MSADASGPHDPVESEERTPSGEMARPETASSDPLTKAVSVAQRRLLVREGRTRRSVNVHPVLLAIFWGVAVVFVLDTFGFFQWRPPASRVDVRHQGGAIASSPPSPAAGGSASPSAASPVAGRSASPSAASSAAGGSASPSAPSPAAGGSASPSAASPVAGRSASPSAASPVARRSASPSAPSPVAGRSASPSAPSPVAAQILGPPDGAVVASLNGVVTLGWNRHTLDRWRVEVVAGDRAWTMRTVTRPLCTLMLPVDAEFRWRVIDDRDGSQVVDWRRIEVTHNFVIDQEGTSGATGQSAMSYGEAGGRGGDGADGPDVDVRVDMLGGYVRVRAETSAGFGSTRFVLPGAPPILVVARGGRGGSGGAGGYGPGTVLREGGRDVPVGSPGGNGGAGGNGGKGGTVVLHVAPGLERYVRVDVSGGAGGAGGPGGGGSLEIGTVPGSTGNRGASGSSGAAGRIIVGPGSAR